MYHRFKNNGREEEFLSTFRCRSLSHCSAVCSRSDWNRKSPDYYRLSRSPHPRSDSWFSSSVHLRAVGFYLVESVSDPQVSQLPADIVYLLKCRLLIFARLTSVNFILNYAQLLVPDGLQVDCVPALQQEGQGFDSSVVNDGCMELDILWFSLRL